MSQVTDLGVTQGFRVDDNGRIWTEPDGLQAPMHLCHHDTLTLKFATFDLVCERTIDPLPQTAEEYAHALSESLRRLSLVPDVPADVIVSLQTLLEKYSPKWGEGDYAI